ncbi:MULTISPECIES: cob(I)yrinic acid a,c-diamide adenosyltransferase [Actinomadura]|uniref:Corrinoid adenosyltransferase n=1 Tax=Actinomadura litoris TaxID=2678616 RepID=A0A7K1KYD6_9ACTN|nr:MULTISPECIES: cob(I)yrinic acid a,c-diamide adenosyltransferase [Actinomadura]MBT2209224.1 cob(I)yrinic acid a,c-diamide adenosyltransferase [Actinomadura sp. NEAU-AAG7]MUN36966.1 cob(I)yrinic acid a,c-diamide adenosyltransferase [Actinomadura litoris]
MAKNRETPVVLSQIYTRTGDDGTTALGDASRTPKTDPRLSAYADVEEANAAIGVALALGSLPEPLVALLTRVQNDLFDVGADLCAPVVPDPRYPPLRVDPSYIERLEADCDEHNADLDPLRSFILPGGTPGAALLHVARTVTRRAERSAWAAIEAHGAAADGDPDAAEGGVNPLTARYLNRLSDLLFILCRVANAGRGDILWKPGGER